MKSPRVIISSYILSLTGLLFNASIHAALLSGSYSYDATTNLYTYNYMIDNTLVNDPNISGYHNWITNIGISISDEYDSSVSPDSYTNTPTWNLNYTTLIDPNESASRGYDVGSYFVWGVSYPSGGVAPGSSLGGFSITSQYAPSSMPYYVYAVQAGWYVEKGYVVAPDIPGINTPATIPAPPAIWLLGSGLISLISIRRQRKSQNS